MYFIQFVCSFLLAFSLSMHVTAQESVYFYGSNYRPLRSMENAKFMQQIVTKRDKRQVIEFFSRDEGQWNQTETWIVKEVGNNGQSIRIKDSPFFAKRMYRSYSYSGGKYDFTESVGQRILRTGSALSLVPLLLDGEVVEYFTNGQVKSRSIYRNNQLVSNLNWLRDGTEYISNIFYSVDTIPEYSLGNRFFRNHMLQGISASKYDITEVYETIVIGFVITEEGKLTGVQRVSGKLMNLSDILIKLVESLEGDWSPAILDGKPVRYFMTIPFNFKSESGRFNHVELSNGMLIWD